MGQKNYWVENFLGQKKPGWVDPRWRIYDPPPPQKIVGLILCWIVVSLAWYGRLKNFRPLGSLFLVEVEFVWVGWGVCKVIIMSNPTKLRLGYG